MYKGRTNIFQQISTHKGQVAVLIDPEKSRDKSYLKNLVERAVFAKVHYFFVGGSTVSHSEFEECINYLKSITKIPIVIFPGSSHQVSNQADAILFLNLISGRNPDFLIGHQVVSAPELHKINLEVIPTAYILIDGGRKTSVQYVSQTTPIPREQHTIAMNTALAGKMMGNQLLYFDAGSGAINSIDPKMISAIKQATNSALIVGGGIRTTEQMEELSSAGANVIVIGNYIEENIDFLLDVKNFSERKA